VTLNHIKRKLLRGRDSAGELTARDSVNIVNPISHYDVADSDTDLQDEDLSGRAINVEFTVRRIIGIDTLAGQEIDDVLRSVFVPISRGDLRVKD